MHDVNVPGLAAMYRAEDAKKDTENLGVKCKCKSGRTESTHFVFKDSYRDEYTNDEIPLGHVCHAIVDEIEYLCDDKVWVLVPLEEAQKYEESKVIGSRRVNSNNNDNNDPDVCCRPVDQELNLHQDEPFLCRFSNWNLSEGYSLILSICD